MAWASIFNRLVWVSSGPGDLDEFGLETSLVTKVMLITFGDFSFRQGEGAR